MLLNIITSIFVGFFILTLLGGIVEFLYNLKFNQATTARYWIIPAIFAAAVWFCTHL